MTAQAPSFPVTKAIVVKVALTIRRRSGRKCVIVIAPDADGDCRATGAAHGRPDPIAVAVARAHCWKELLDSGRYGSITELTRQLKVDFGYVSRLLQLTLLAPDIVEGILSGNIASGLSLAKLGWGLPLLWPDQRIYLEQQVARRRMDPATAEPLGLARRACPVARTPKRRG